MSSVTEWNDHKSKRWEQYDWEKGVITVGQKPQRFLQEGVGIMSRRNNREQRIPS